MRDKLWKTSVGLRAKTYIHLINDGSEDKNAKNRKKYVIKKDLNLKITKSV